MTKTTISASATGGKDPSSTSLSPDSRKEEIAASSSPSSLRSSSILGLNAVKQLVCGGVAGSVAKTVTAPLSRLTILYQVHSMVTTKENRPNFSNKMAGGFRKIVERGGILSLWQGNGTSVLHRFPFSAINFFVYESMLSAMSPSDNKEESISPFVRFTAGATAGSIACIGCYPLDLVRTRLTTELPGHRHYTGIFDAFRKIYVAEGFKGYYSGIVPTLMVAVPNFAISYTVYGTLKEYALDDELFYNLRVIDDESGEHKLGFKLTLMCGSASGALATLVTFPLDTVRRRMQIQNLHIKPEDRKDWAEQILSVLRREGAIGLYRGLTPEMIKVLPMVGTMFFVYECMKDALNISVNGR